ncbi:MAG: LysM peptidoglycan-binding domain-containing protein [Saprospiraceae bacterium]
MRKILIILLCSFCASLQAQQPLYLTFASECMDQLEYRYLFNNTGVTVYSVKPNATEQYLFTAGASGINSPTLPKGAISCRELTLNAGFTDAINSQSRQVYMVHQTASGYLLMPLISATQVVRSGSFYMFKAPNYDFALDTTNLIYEANLALSASASQIYFTGLKIHNCLYEYAFRREPRRGGEKSDFEFIPRVGFISERTGINTVQAESNQMRLIAVNGRPLDEFLASRCAQRSPSSQFSASKWTNPLDYSTGATQPIREQDKEMSSLPPTSPYANTAGAASGLADCPEAPGRGYHIVQPGDNLHAIGRTYGVKTADLVKWNKLKNPNHIEICQKIYLSQPPAGATASVPKSAATPKSPEKPANVGPTVKDQSIYWDQPASPSRGTQLAPKSPGAAATPPKGVVAAPPGAVQPMIHVVQPGETLSGIAQKYGYTEARYRQINNMPPTGDVLLRPGERLLASDCLPASAPVNVSNITIPAAPAQEGQTPKASPSPVSFSSPTPAPAAAPAPAASDKETFSEAPVSVAPGNQKIPPPQPAGANIAPSYQEYIVRQGDTLGSIAAQHGVSAAEISLLNNKEPNDQLVPGQRLLIPRR